MTETVEGVTSTGAKSEDGTDVVLDPELSPKERRGLRWSGTDADREWRPAADPAGWCADAGRGRRFLAVVAFVMAQFLLLGYEPGFIQAAFRIGDSATNGLSPLNPYMVIILGFRRAYAPNAGLGTVIARALPFSLVFLVLWIVVLAVFFFTGTPVGPGRGIHL